MAENCENDRRIRREAAVDTGQTGEDAGGGTQGTFRNHDNYIMYVFPKSVNGTLFLHNFNLINLGGEVTAHPPPGGLDKGEVERRLADVVAEQGLGSASLPSLQTQGGQRERPS